jgi:hypothetical protein
MRGGVCKDEAGYREQDNKQTHGLKGMNFKRCFAFGMKE